MDICFRPVASFRTSSKLASSSSSSFLCDTVKEATMEVEVTRTGQKKLKPVELLSFKLDRYLKLVKGTNFACKIVLNKTDQKKTGGYCYLYMISLLDYNYPTFFCVQINTAKKYYTHEIEWKRIITLYIDEMKISDTIKLVRLIDENLEFLSFLRMPLSNWNEAIQHELIEGETVEFRINTSKNIEDRIVAERPRSLQCNELLVCLYYECFNLNRLNAKDHICINLIDKNEKKFPECTLQFNLLQRITWGRRSVATFILLLQMASP